MVFDDFLLQKAVSVDSFTKIDAKCLRPGFGLGRAGWAGLGWLGWAGLGWAGWAGLDCLENRDAMGYNYIYGALPEV